MSRPPPSIINSYYRDHYHHEVLAAERVFAVCFDGKPIGIRLSNLLSNMAFKYRRTTFVNKGHAVRLAEKLNAALNTNRFAVYVLAPQKELE